MRPTLIAILVILFVAVLATRIGTMIKWKDALGHRVDYYVNLVNEGNVNALRADIVRDAANLGLTLVPDNICIRYEDTAQSTLPQQMVANKIGAQFINKRASIMVRYDARVLGIPISQQVSRSHIHQVQAIRPVPVEAEKQEENP